jgi:hypothetical protein
MVIECYAQRLLSPFRGTMLTIRYEAAEAVTLDGVRWDIYVANDQLRDGVEARGRIQVSDVRYGSWSRAQGLRRGAIYPSEDFRRMEAMGAVVYEHLLRVHEQVPFPFADRFELWLLDREGRPLALLQSAVREADVTLDHAPYWHAGILARERFASPAMDGLSDGGAAPAEYLERYVNDRAGPRPAAQWFERGARGTGVGLKGIGLPATLERRTLPAEDFPLLALADLGHDAAHCRLFEDFQAWQAPWLLTLGHLDRATRARLEVHARAQALAVQAHHRLYPELAEEGTIRAALVEAMLRGNRPAPPERRPGSISTFYIELEDGPPDLTPSG